LKEFEALDVKIWGFFDLIIKIAIGIS